jgi:hypothetical protein
MTPDVKALAPSNVISLATPHRVKYSRITEMMWPVLSLLSFMMLSQFARMDILHYTGIFEPVSFEYNIMISAI